MLLCPSFFIVSKFAKDLLINLKSILTGLNMDTEITLQYDVLGRAMCSYYIVVLILHRWKTMATWVIHLLTKVDETFD